MGYPIGELDGIGLEHTQILIQEGIRSTDHLLEACRTPRGRKAVAGKTGIDEGRLLYWTHLSDLVRIKGVACQYAGLLMIAGVESLKHMKSCRAEALSVSMREINAEKNLAKVSPSIAVVKKWIDQAKTLPNKVVA